MEDLKELKGKPVRWMCQNAVAIMEFICTFQWVDPDSEDGEGMVEASQFIYGMLADPHGGVTGIQMLIVDAAEAFTVVEMEEEAIPYSFDWIKAIELYAGSLVRHVRRWADWPEEETCKALAAEAILMAEEVPPCRPK
jgi:hypothetical protein